MSKAYLIFNVNFPSPYFELYVLEKIPLIYSFHKQVP